MLTPGDTNILESEKPVSVFDLTGGTNRGSWLNQNYPNPCTGQTIISYRLSHPGSISLVLYDLFGRVIISLVNEYQKPDDYNVLCNTEGLTSGSYFYTLRIDNKMINTRMMIVK
jgi:hypothetical protein